MKLAIKETRLKTSSGIPNELDRFSFFDKIKELIDKKMV